VKWIGLKTGADWIALRVGKSGNTVLAHHCRFAARVHCDPHRRPRIRQVHCGIPAFGGKQPRVEELAARRDLHGEDARGSELPFRGLAARKIARWGNSRHVSVAFAVTATAVAESGPYPPMYAQFRMAAARIQARHKRFFTRSKRAVGNHGAVALGRGAEANVRFVVLPTA
jgi:hypothetical protein